MMARTVKTLDPDELRRLRAAVGVVVEPEPAPAIEPDPEPEPPPPTPSERAFIDANDRRSREASARRVAEAEAALTDLTVPYTELEVNALRLRVTYPVDTLAELGEKCDVSKHVVSSALRRAYLKAVKAGVIDNE